MYIYIYCMYIYMCVCVCVSMCVHTHTYIILRCSPGDAMEGGTFATYIHTNMRACIHTYTHATYMHACMHT